MTTAWFRWAGGGLFVVALAYCGWSELVAWGRTGAQPFAAGAAAFDLLLFLAFAGHHSLLARDPVKRRLAALIPADLLRATYVWTASILLIVTCALWLPIGGLVYAMPSTVAWMGDLVQFAGLLLTARAMSVLDGLELAGIREAATITIDSRGPYRWVRHPIYSGWLLMVFGPPHMTGDRLVFALASTAYLVAAIPWEERSLARAAGDQYRRYCERVRWRVIPGIY